MRDLQTQVVRFGFNYRRVMEGLPDTLIFEHRELDGTFTVLGSINDGWCTDEVVGEVMGGAVEEYQVMITQQPNLDTLAQKCTNVLVGPTRYEKRAVDPAVGTPQIVRLRCQPITGYASY
jgi:hypothetical protein